MRSLLAATVPPHNSCKTSFCSKPHSEVITGYRLRSIVLRSIVHPRFVRRISRRLRTFSSGNRRIRSAG
jgi:hypothetical protein